MALFTGTFHIIYINSHYVMFNLASLNNYKINAYHRLAVVAVIEEC